MEKKELIHSRNIQVNCFETGDTYILVEGWLTDERFSPAVLYSTGETRDPGVFHHMAATMAVSIHDLTIISVEADMPVVPVETCREIKDCVQKLVGLQIRHGFTDTVRLLIGYTEGCVHLMNLILAMGSAAIQGAGTYFTRKRDGVPAKMPAGTDMDRSVLVNTCWLWREDGPLMRIMKGAQVTGTGEKR